MRELGRAACVAKSQVMRESAVMISSTIPVGEILLLGIAAHVLERRDRQRRLIGERQRAARPECDGICRD